VLCLYLWPLYHRNLAVITHSFIGILLTGWHDQIDHRPITIITVWPLVWKTWKCRGIWQLWGILLEVREMSIQVFSRIGVCSVLNIQYIVSDHALLHSYPTADSNTSTGMIWVTLYMPSAAEECCEPSGNFTLSGKWSPCIRWWKAGDLGGIPTVPGSCWQFLMAFSLAGQCDL